MREAIDAGASSIGENRVQEAMGKKETLGRDVEWHLIGHLQTNKAKYAVKLFDLIHSVDSRKLAETIDREAEKIAKVQDVLIQVNVAREDTKFGVEMEQTMDLAAYIAARCPHLRLRGLMTIAPQFDDAEKARPVFRALYLKFRELQAKKLPHADIAWLSMGMTGDYEIAVEEGANAVRVGTGIFGPRQY